MTAANISAKNLALLTAVAAPLASLSLALTTILPQDLTRNHGVTLAQAGFAFMIIRLADIAIDPFLGSLMDRTRSRLGRYQIWILGGSLPLGVGVLLCFFPPAQVSFPYLIFALATAYLGFSIMALSHLALCAAQTEDYAARGKVFAWWQVYTTIGLLVAMLLPKLLDGRLGLDLVQWMGITILGLITTSTLATVFLSKASPAKAPGAHGGFKAYLALFALPATRRVMLAELFLGLSAGIAAVTGLMYITSIKHFTIGDFGSQLVIYFLVGMISSPAWAWISARMEKHRALMLGAICLSLSQLIFLLVPPGNLLFLLLVPAVFGGFSYTSVSMLPRAMLADVADEERLLHGSDRTALLFALLTGIFKLGHALSVGIGFLALNAFGYVPALGADNSPAALTGLAIVYGGFTTVCAMIAFCAMIRYPLTGRRHSEIRAALEKLDGAKA
jgi:Na+/melibiose symporter-like transporter